MRKVIGVCLSLFLLVGMLTACNKSEHSDETVPLEMVYELGESGVKVTLPTELGLEQRTDAFNDYFGAGASGDWAIIVISDEKGGYALEEYADLTAEVNDAVRASRDSNGNYYFTYIHEGYHFYTAVREGADKYYRVVFYCFNNVWADYSERFEQWAQTLEVA